MTVALGGRQWTFREALTRSFISGYFPRKKEILWNVLPPKVPPDITRYEGSIPRFHRHPRRLGAYRSSV
jgi:hypothetical protein